MNNRKVLGVGTIVIALILSIISVTIAFAAYNSNLTINGNATVKGANWSVVFIDLQSPATLGNDNNMTTTAKEITAPEIVGDTAIEDYNVELQTPGDFVSYNFKIKNSGDFPAKIDTFSMPTPTCTKGTNGVDADATNVCDNIEYTLKYVSDSSDVKAGDTFDIGEEKEVQLKIYYKKTVLEGQLPTDDVAIGNLDIVIPFVQY